MNIEQIAALSKTLVVRYSQFKESEHSRAKDGKFTESGSTYRLPSIDGMRKALDKAGVSHSHISSSRSLLQQRTMLQELMKEHKLSLEDGK